MKKLLRQLIFWCGFGLITAILFSTSAFAYLTPINPVGWDGPEWSLINSGGILDTLYGPGNLVRIDDNEDQIWHVTTEGQATVEAKAAGYWQTLYAGSQQLFSSVEGFGYSFSVSVLPANSVAITTTGNFAFYDDPNGQSTSPEAWSSIQSENSYGYDHMVTWKIINNAGSHSNNQIGNYVLGWEDLNLGDYDYNDLVVEVSRVSPAVPEPSSVVLLGLGLLGLVGLRKRKIT